MSPLALWVSLAAGALALGLFLWWLSYRYWVRRLGIELEYERTERLETPDGSYVELRRLPVHVDGGRAGPPVLLVHGLALNHRNHDMSEDLSLGRHLAKAGRDVWLLTLRSGREDLGFFEEQRATFEAMAANDIPTGVDAVLERTDAEALDYVGFSMGGMLMYACHGRFIAPEKLRRVAIIGSPARIVPPLAMLSQVARIVPSWIIPTLRLRIVSRSLAFASEIVKTPIHRWVYNPENVDRGVAARALVNGFVNIPSGLASELVRWAADDGVVRYGGAEVTDSLRAARTPVIFVAGAADRLAPPSAVRLAYDAWGADAPGVDKTFCIMGIDHGAAADYGHGDLAIGRFAEQDVFDPVREFLEPSDSRDARQG